MLTLYGIPNCDSCRKARRWLESENADYRFHDLRVDGVSRELLERWLGATDWKALLNTRSTTWRALDDADKSGVDAERAVALMLAHPTLIKRPVIEKGRTVLVGFSPQALAPLVG
jgi:arsenate reductase